MGLLDDAIRDHLDLKRSRGADPDEIARLEHEALGPVRREPFEREDHEPGPGVDDASLSLTEREPESANPDYEEYYEEEYYAEEEGADAGEPFAEGEGEGLDERRSRRRTSEPRPGRTRRAAGEPAPEAEEQRGFRRWRRSRRTNMPPEEAPPTQAGRPEAPEEGPPGEETIEYGVDEALGARRGKPEPGSDQRLADKEGDVLEETPEFLQDAPEHDRLWFEQRPPRDFDFDD